MGWQSGLRALGRMGCVIHNQSGGEMRAGRSWYGTGGMKWGERLLRVGIDGDGGVGCIVCVDSRRRLGFWLGVCG